MVPGGEPPQGAARPARPTPARLTPPAQPAPAAAQPELTAQPEVAALPGPGLVNVANALTVLRLILVPVFVACLLAGGPDWRVAVQCVVAEGALTGTDVGGVAGPHGHLPPRCITTEAVSRTG